MLLTKDTRSSANARVAAEHFGLPRSDLTHPETYIAEQVQLDSGAGTIAAQDAEATDFGDGEQPSEPVPPTMLSWLGGAVIDGLVQCACSYQWVPADLLPLPSGEVSATVTSHPAAAER